MKVRLGFVSNSSSSSFCIYGVSFEGILSAFYQLKEGVAEKYNIEDSDDLFDKFDVLCGKSLRTVYDGYEWYIGLTPDQMNDDETKREFKTRIAKELSKFFKDIDTSKIEFYLGEEEY